MSETNTRSTSRIFMSAFSTCGEARYRLTKISHTLIKQAIMLAYVVGVLAVVIPLRLTECLSAKLTLTCTIASALLSLIAGFLATNIYFNYKKYVAAQENEFLATATLHELCSLADLIKPNR